MNSKLALCKKTSLNVPVVLPEVLSWYFLTRMEKKKKNPYRQKVILYLQPKEVYKWMPRLSRQQEYTK